MGFGKPFHVGLSGACQLLLLLSSGAVTLRAEEPQFGVEFRVRNENWNNLFDYNNGVDDERRQIRYRGRIWAKVPLTSTVDFNFGLNDETYQKLGKTSVYDEVIVDQFNLHIRKLFVSGLSLKVGRQDLIRGEGFILLDGTPGDGSRSIYFNAANLQYNFRRSTLEFMAILDPKQDRMLPRFNDQHKYLMDWDDQALGIYYTDKNKPNTWIETYFFHKKEVNNRLAPTHPQYQPDRRVETLGGRVTQKFAKSWTAVSEFAGQWGLERPSTPTRGWGGYGYVKRQFDARWKPYVLGGFWALSGDDPNRTDRVSGWNPIFSRWPKWGDLELYTQASEQNVGYATNQTRWHLEGGIVPHPRLSWKFYYYKVGAFHPFAGSKAMFGNGLNRGTDLQSRFDFMITPNVKGHVELQTLSPGTFYAVRDRAYFLRFEMIANAKFTLQNIGRLF